MQRYFQESVPDDTCIRISSARHCIAFCVFGAPFRTIVVSKEDRSAKRSPPAVILRRCNLNGQRCDIASNRIKQSEMTS